MPDIIIQSDGSLLVPRGLSADNQFFSDLIKDIADEDVHKALENFFLSNEESEIIFGSPGLCG